MAIEDLVRARLGPEFVAATRELGEWLAGGAGHTRRVKIGPPGVSVVLRAQLFDDGSASLEAEFGASPGAPGLHDLLPPGTSFPSPRSDLFLRELAERGPDMVCEGVRASLRALLGAGASPGSMVEAVWDEMVREIMDS